MKINLWRGKNAIKCKFPLFFYFYFYILHINNKITSHSKKYIYQNFFRFSPFIFVSFTFKTLYCYAAIGVNFKVDFIVEQQEKNLLVEQDR